MGQFCVRQIINVYPPLKRRTSGRQSRQSSPTQIIDQTTVKGYDTWPLPPPDLFRPAQDPSNRLGSRSLKSLTPTRHDSYSGGCVEIP